MKVINLCLVVIHITVLALASIHTVEAASRLRYTGVNLAGADFGAQVLPGTYNQNYTYPTHGEIDYFVGKGMNTFRLPFRWERLQQTAFAAFNAEEQARIDDFVNYATSKGAYVLLDPHNYARYYGRIVGEQVPTAAFADFWAKLAGRYKNNSRVFFGLMNEPSQMSTEVWLTAANAAIQAIRAAEATNLILVPGNGWSGAMNWSESWYGTPNSVVMLGINDPYNNYAFDAHQYLDSNGSGNSDVCMSATVGVERLVKFTNWLRQNNKRGFLGEFAGGGNNTCYAALDNMLSYMENNSDVWIGWTYWAAGPWWGNYIFTIEPIGTCPGNACVDRPQMAYLLPHLSNNRARTAFDFDGDGKADVSVFRPDNGTWYLNQSTNAFTGVQFGDSTDKLVPADYDGDGRTDVAVYRGGTWYLNRSLLGFTGISFGEATDIPVPADYDADGKANIAVFRPSNATWYLMNSTTEFTVVAFGLGTDKPVPADYDGDGKANIAVFRPSNGTWYTSQNPATNYGAIVYGEMNDIPVPADYDGDGKADAAVFRPSNGSWFMQRSSLGFTGVQFGISTDLPAAADYDGDGKADVAVFRSGTWYLNRSTSGFTGVSFGTPTDKPVPNAFVP